MNQEEELKKAREQYDAENQEIYDEVTKGNEELRRRKDNKPETYEQLPLFSRLNDAIEGKINQFGQFVADAAEDKEGISDDIVRGGLRGLQFVGNLPVIKQIGQLEEGIVGGVRNLAERQNLIDPRSFTYGTRIGLAFAGDKGIRKVVQTGKKVSAIAKAERIMKANQNPALKGMLMQSISGQPPSGSGFNWASFGYKVDGRTGKLKLPTLVKELKTQETL